MNEQEADLHATPDLHAWSKVLAPYREPRSDTALLAAESIGMPRLSTQRSRFPCQIKDDP